MTLADLLRRIRHEWAEHVGDVGTDASVDATLVVLDAAADAVDRERPAPPSGTPVQRRGSRMAERVRELAERGMRDPEIGAELGVNAVAVRSLRRRHGIAGHDPRPRKTGWEDRLRELHAEGLTDPEIAERGGWTVRTVQQHRYVLGLPANRRRPRQDQEP